MRLPLDAAINLLPGDGTGIKPTAALTVDRADAAVRTVVATVLSDGVMREDAQRCRAAALEQNAKERRGAKSERERLGASRNAAEHVKLALAERAPGASTRSARRTTRCARRKRRSLRVMKPGACATLRNARRRNGTRAHRD